MTLIDTIQNTERTIKIAILGVGSVGKTTISRSYTQDPTYLKEVVMTKGVDIATKKITLNNNKYIVQIWDFAGQKQFRFMIDFFLKGVKGIIYVYDTTDIETLFYLDEFLEVTRDFFGKSGYENIPEILVGNKIDSDETETEIEDIYSFMERNNIKKHYFVSGIMGENVSEPFTDIINEIVKDCNNSKSDYYITQNQYLSKIING